MGSSQTLFQHRNLMRINDRRLKGVGSTALQKAQFTIMKKITLFLLGVALSASVSFVPSSNAAGSAPLGSPLTVSLPSDTVDASVPIGTVFLEPVNTTNIDPGLNYVGFQGDFNFDSTVITFSAPYVNSGGLTANNWNVSANILPEGDRSGLYACRPSRSISRR